MDMAAMPVQLPAHPATEAAGRARFFNSGNAFNIKLPPVPGGILVDAARRALAPDAPTGFIACDRSAALGCAGPATTPLMLARYATIRPGDTLDVDFVASGSLWYVIAGAGILASDGEEIAWAAGDVFSLPGRPAVLRAGPERAVLWAVGNDPHLAFEGLRPCPPAPTGLRPVHYPAAEIRRQIDLIYEAAPNEATSGMALIFSADRLEASRNVMPTLTLSLNTLPPRSHQRAHRHNSAALTLVVEGEACRSVVDDGACDWERWGTVVTPPGAVHSHHNDGPTRALFLIVQDGGLYYHARTMGFEFREDV